MAGHLRGPLAAESQECLLDNVAGQVQPAGDARGVLDEWCLILLEDRSHPRRLVLALVFRHSRSLRCALIAGSAAAIHIDARGAVLLGKKLGRRVSGEW